MFPITASMIDKSLPVPVGTQLRGLLAYALSFWSLPAGTRVQSVRQLAAELGIAPMTVAQVYQQLRDEGLIEMRPGRGAFVAAVHEENLIEEDGALGALSGQMDDLILSARSLNVPLSDLASLFTARVQLLRTGSGLDVVFVGVFALQTADYISQLKEAFSPADRVSTALLSDLQTDAALRARVVRADLILTFPHRVGEVRGLLGPQVPEVYPVRFVPSRETRMNLAGLDPRAVVAAVSYFEEYVAIMRPAVREFAPHVSDVRATWDNAPDLASHLAACDVLVYASGAEHLIVKLRQGKSAFEYRHAVCPIQLERGLVPHVKALRRAKFASQ